MKKYIALILAFVLAISVTVSWTLHSAAQERRIQALEQQVIELQDQQARQALSLTFAQRPELDWWDHVEMIVDELERVHQDEEYDAIPVIVKDLRAIIEEVNKEQAEEIAQIIYEEATKRDIDPYLLAAMAYRESHFRPNARGKCGEYGLIQIMPSTGRWIAKKLGYNDWEPEQMMDLRMNIEFAAYYLWAVTKDMGGDTWKGVLAYNAGPGGAKKWLAKSDVWSHDYVRKVRSTYLSLQKGAA